MSTFDRRRVLGAAAAVGVGGLLRRSASAAEAAAPRQAGEDLSKLLRTPHTRFAANLEMWWTDLPFLDRVREAAKLGFPGIEFWPWKGKDVDAIARTCRELKLEVAQFSAWGFRPGLNHPDHHADFVKTVEEACAVAKKLDSKGLCVVAGDDQPGMTKEEMHAHVIAGLKLGAPVAERNGITLLLEPMNGRVDHPGHCLYGSADALKIVRAVGSPSVKILWDLYHMHISEGDLCGHLREGFAEIGYVQLADHPGRHEPGTGEIYYPRVLRELHELGYRGWVGAECVPAGEELAAARALAKADVW